MKIDVMRCIDKLISKLTVLRLICQEDVWEVIIFGTLEQEDVWEVIIFSDYTLVVAA